MTASMGGLRGASRRQGLQTANRHERLDEDGGQDPERSQTIVDGAIVFPRILNAVYGQPHRSARLAESMRSVDEPAASLVDPDLQSRSARIGDDIGVAVPIDVSDEEPQDEVSSLQPQRSSPVGETHVELGQFGADA